MQDSNTYRQYANDCRRIAETMSAKDKAIMLEMAKVWDERAEDAERAEKNKAGAVSCIKPVWHQAAATVSEPESGTLSDIEI